MNFPPLFAVGLDEILGIAVFIIFVIGSLLRALSAVKQQGQKPGGGQPPPQRPAPRDALSDEIDEFLRRATQRKPRPQQAVRPRRQPAAIPQQAVEGPVQAEVVAARPVSGGLDKHLQQFAREKKEFEERAAHLGDEVAQADDKLTAHLKEKFTHKLGKLERRSEEPAAPPSPAGVLFPHALPAAAGFAALLSHADSLRQAVVLTEILHRPVERWE
ncbi:MAG: hypothetical protein JXB10_18935 [Pirellulales bacterium]|nr:hypothetical protein [Pirellulales bacterium]